MLISIEILVEAHANAGFIRSQDSDESCITFECGPDMCFHPTIPRSLLLESTFVIDDDRQWNSELSDKLEQYFDERYLEHLDNPP